MICHLNRYLNQEGKDDNIGLEMDRIWTWMSVSITLKCCSDKV